LLIGWERFGEAKYVAFPFFSKVYKDDFEMMDGVVVVDYCTGDGGGVL
jgi:hypothetical protein